MDASYIQLPPSNYQWSHIYNLFTVTTTTTIVSLLNVIFRGTYYGRCTWLVRLGTATTTTTVVPLLNVIFRGTYYLSSKCTWLVRLGTARDCTLTSQCSMERLGTVTARDLAH